MGLGGLDSFGLDVVAGQIWLLVGRGLSPVVGCVVGLSTRWVVRPFQVMVQPLLGGLWAGGAGWWAVVVVLGLVVVVVVVVVVALGVVVVVVVVLVVVVVVGELVVAVVVVGLMVIVVLWARSQDPLALR